MKRPWDPSYDANSKQMKKIYAEQWPHAWKNNLSKEDIEEIEEQRKNKTIPESSEEEEKGFIGRKFKRK